MGFWPFGREPEEVEMASRVVTAHTRDRFVVRGKLTVHFLEPLTQPVADETADQMVALCAEILRDAPDHRTLIGGEAAVVSQLVARLPQNIAPTRAFELVSLHVVGDPGPAAAARRPSSGAFAAVVAPGTPVISTAPPTAVGTPQPGATASPIPFNRVTIPTPPGMTPIPGANRPPRRASSTRIRAVVISPGSSPLAMGASIAPLVRDSAARILVGLLRAYDLFVLRRVALDESSPEMLSALIPVSEVPPGAFESSRMQELGRWQGTLGPDVFGRLRHDAAVLSVYLAHAAMIEASVPPPLATQVVDAICGQGFRAEESPLAGVGRWLSAVHPNTANEIAGGMVQVLGQPDQTAALSRGLLPLLAAVQEDMSFVATLVRHAATS